MNRSQALALGIVVTVAILFLPKYQSGIAGAIALAIVALVIAGFVLSPKRNVFYVRTSTFALDADGELTVEHEQIAVRIELARLWLLFIPTFIAIAFLLITAAHGTTLQIDLLDELSPPVFSSNPLIFYEVEVFVMIAWFALTRWLYERRVFRDAEATNAQWVQSEGRQLKYSFVTREGDYYGNTLFLRFRSRPNELESLAFYNIKTPDLNVITCAMAFHRATVIARGITELDEETAWSKAREIAPNAT